ncbi:MAG: universal protein YeaZ [Flavipsychrobacter sp.]|jgi:tRNA threonylcarbamoyladenosine biosynthesis protein TsaB|nr:universal protein YeaZ [Flavipsychrobacter sp.]
MQYLLHIDTSTDTGAVAIGADGKLLAIRTNTETRNHAATLNVMINDVLADAHISLQQLNGIVVCAGPGSYTGLRIGMSTAKGLSYALDIPLLLDNRLTLLAYYACKQHADASQYISLLFAREKEYFIAVYDTSFTCILSPQHIMEEQLNILVKNMANTAIITNVPDIANQLKFNNLRILQDTQINFDLWVSYAFEQYKNGSTVNLATAEPFYLKQVFTHK